MLSTGLRLVEWAFVVVDFTGALVVAVLFGGAFFTATLLLEEAAASLVDFPEAVFAAPAWRLDTVVFFVSFLVATDLSS